MTNTNTYVNDNNSNNDIFAIYPATTNFLVGNFGLRRAGRYAEHVSDVDEI